MLSPEGRKWSNKNCAFAELQESWTVKIREQQGISPGSKVVKGACSGVVENRKEGYNPVEKTIKPADTTGAQLAEKESKSSKIVVACNRGDIDGKKKNGWSCDDVHKN